VEVEKQNLTEGIEHKAAKSGGILLFRHGFAFIANFLGGIALYRIVGPEKMGLYFTTYTYFIIGRQIIDFTVSTYLIQQPENPDHRKLSTCFWFQSALALCLLAIAATAIFLGVPQWYVGASAGDFTLLLLAAAIGVLGYSFQSLSVAMLERKLVYTKVGLIEVSDPVVFNLLAVGLVYLGWDVKGLALALVVRGILPAFLSSLLSGFFPSFQTDWKWLKSSLGKILPLVTSQLVNWITLLIPSAILVKMAGSSQFAFANAAYTLLGSMGFITGIVQRISLASFARLQAEPERLNRLAERMLGLLLMVYVPVYFGLGATASLWVPRLYGKDWSPTAEVLLWGVLPNLLVGLFTIFNSSALAGGMNKLVLKQNLLAAIIFTIAMVSFAHRLGSITWPVAHLLNVPCALLYVRAHFKRFGALHLGVVAVSLVLGVGWMIGVHILLIKCWWISAILLGVAFPALWIPWMWKRNNLTSVIQKILSGKSEEAVD
jgi:O-antigen/teichoic acid export membrane protein